MKYLLQRVRQCPQPTLLAVIVVAFLVFFVQLVFELPLPDRYGAVPEELTRAWAELGEGRFDKGTLVTATRLFTPLFLHGDVEHVGFNMIFLWCFGSLVARHLGTWWMVLLFFLTGACGNILQVCLNPGSSIPIVGASGAVCGCQGIYLGLALRWALSWPDVWPLARAIPPLQLAAFAVMGIGLDYFALMNHDGQRIAYGAHLGGFLSGLVVAACVTQVYPTEASYKIPRHHD